MKKERVSFRIWLAMKIARTMLFIKATTFKKLTEEPYKWACGMMMRIYNDNRMMLGNYMHRMRVMEGFIHLIRIRGSMDPEYPDFIIGTMTSGIAPAASVAQYLGKKLLVHDGEKYLCYGPELYTKDSLKYISEKHNEDADIIISLSINAIPQGIQYANLLEKPFAYVRGEAKDHGKKQQIEGIIKPGMKFIVIHETDQVIDIVIRKIEDDYKIQCLTAFPAINKCEIIPLEELAGKTAVIIEDLFSTGGSAAFEVHKARAVGLICDYCFSIFSYGFDCLKKQFSGEINISNKDFKLTEPCEIDSLLSFPVLMEVIKRMKFYPKETIRAMEAEINTFDQRYEKFLEEKNKIG